MLLTLVPLMKQISQKLELVQEDSFHAKPKKINEATRNKCCLIVNPGVSVFPRIV